jgi:carboxyl-terminal processing protease
VAGVSDASRQQARGELLIAAAKAAASADTYSQLNLLGDVFERVRTDYVESRTTKLVEAAISGMVTSLDPHSRYMNDKAWREMQETTHGEFGGLGIEVTMEDGVIKVWRRWTIRPRQRSESCRAT